MRFLSVVPHAGGNVPPTIAIARELQRRGHDVELLGHPQLGDRIRRAGLAFSPFAHARRWSASVENPGLRSMLGWLTLASDRGIGRDLTEAAANGHPDVVIVDCMVPAALPAARSVGAPVATLLHTFSEYWADQWSPSTPMGLWLRATGTMTRCALPDLALLTTLPELDDPDPRLPYPAGTLRQVGPVLDPMPEPARPGDDGVVLVSLSTISYPGQLGQLRKIVAALGGLEGLGVRAVVTTGPAIDPALIDAPPNVEVHGFVPHHELIGRARLVIGHGGHGTTMTALAAGVPVIVLPMSSHADHALIAQAVERTGAGAAMTKASTLEEWQAAITRMLEDRLTGQLARALGARIRDTRGVEAAADALEELAASGA